MCGEGLDSLSVTSAQFAEKLEMRKSEARNRGGAVLGVRFYVLGQDGQERLERWDGLNGLKLAFAFELSAS
jgi:hypothetical protein